MKSTIIWCSAHKSQISWPNVFPVGLSQILLTPPSIYLYIKNENMIEPNYLHLASFWKTLNILTLAFSEGCSFPGVRYAIKTDKSDFIGPQDPPFESLLLAENGCRTVHDTALRLKLKGLFKMTSMRLWMMLQKQIKISSNIDSVWRKGMKC